MWRYQQHHRINRCQIEINKRKEMVRRTNNNLKRRLVRLITLFFMIKTFLLMLHDENEPKKVGGNDILSACEYDDDVVDDDNENLTCRNDCGYGTLLTLNTIGANQDINVITVNDTELSQHDVEPSIIGMMNSEQTASENAAQGNMTLTGLQTVENQDFLAVHDTPKMIIEADPLIEQSDQVNKQITVQNSSKRLPLTEEQKIKFKNNVSKTVFVTDETNLVQRLFRTKSVQLFKNITAQAGGEVAQIVRTNKGLRI